MPLQEELEKQGNWLFKYRSYLPIIILIIGFYVYYCSEKDPNIFIFEDTYYEIYYEFICLLIGLIGLVIRAYTVGHTPENTSGRNTQNQVADKLNNSGIYSIVRHPLYLGNFFMWFSVCLLTGNLWFIIAFCLLYWLYYERIMFAEEQFLRNKFGAEYLEWAAKTPAFLPKFKQFTKSDYKFSWKKVLRQEKDGLLALFLIFTFFNISATFMSCKNSYNYYLIIACGVVIVFYSVLKFLKNKTNVLKDNK